MSVFNHTNSALRFLVDEARDHGISGRVVSQRLVAPMEFTDLGSLVLRLEDVMDRQNFPQAFQRSRVFLPAENKENPAADSPENGMDRESVMAMKGKITTFEVTIISRRSSSWQGMVDWLDGSERQEFVSYLELMRLISERRLWN